MKPVFQTHLDVDDHKQGDCFAACLASLLEIPLADVPELGPGNPNWIGDLQDWLGVRGLMALFISLRPQASLTLAARLPEGMHLIGHGKSPRGDWNHAVIVCTTGANDRGYEIVHDPNPAGGGIDPLLAVTMIGLKEPWMYQGRSYRDTSRRFHRRPPSFF